MEVISIEKEKVKKITDFLNDNIDLEDEEIKNIIIYTNYGKILEISLEDK